MFWIDSGSCSSSEDESGGKFVVITPREINELGISMAVPIALVSIDKFSMGFTVAVETSETQGLAVCNQVRSFDMEERLESNSARYIETLSEPLAAEIINRVLSLIEPAKDE